MFKHFANRQSPIASARSLKAWTVAALLCLSGGLAAAPALADEKLDNATCQTCHDGKKGKLEGKTASGDERELKAISTDKYGKGVHATMQCVACHTEIVDAKAPHEKTAAAKKVDCIQCHEQLWEQAKKDNLTKEKARLGIVVDNIEAYKKSFHARVNKEDKTKVYATCNDCHDVHTFDVAPAGTTRRAEAKRENPKMCGTCHEDQLDEYTESVHGKEMLEKHNVKAAVCSDCHTSHAVANTSANPTKLAITASCGNCHEENYESYKKTYHGQVMALGYANTGKCFDCHGSHGIVRVDDEESKVHPDNRLKTCKQCHATKKGLPDATPGFVTFEPHGTTDNLEKYPEIWLASKFMIGLLVGTFAFFWTHTLLWFYREYKDRQARKLRPHVNVEVLPEEYKGKAFQRFPLAWRAAHLTFALSLMVLTLTGMPLFFPDAFWAPVIMKALGGPGVAGTIHRVAATVFGLVFFWHLFYVLTKIARNWKTFKIFGPYSMIPGLQDLRDIMAMFKWFFGKAPRPVFDRWTYWEKFDYWAPFWGVTIIGVSGLMMWFPHVTASFLPGWVFNVAMIFHGEEAILAVVFLFTVHFFNNHFRPDKFPLDTVMFTGTFTLEEFRHEHRLEYDRLVRSGELKKYLVELPSKPMMLRSKILGFVLIACGLSLLAMVVTGFLGY
ncbi:MAG TPA: cytochrome C [Noviherbaspirillum sp.]|nr:cytochrome C [Noviherbaspirillum sp.]